MYWAEQGDNGLSPMQPNVLFLDGFTFDTVVIVTDTMEVDMSERLEPEILWYQLFHRPVFPRAQRPYVNGEPLDLAVFLTLMVGELGFIMYDGLLSPAWDSLHQNQYPNTFPQDYERAKRDIAAFQLASLDVDDGTSQAEVAHLRSAASEGVAEHYHRIAKAFSFGRKLYLTEHGRLGLGPRTMEPGDKVTILFGGRMPFLLRPRDGHSLFIGDSYLRDQAVMWGELSEAVKAGRAAPLYRQTFEIH